MDLPHYDDQNSPHLILPNDTASLPPHYFREEFQTPDYHVIQPAKSKLHSQPHEQPPIYDHQYDNHLPEYIESSHGQADYHPLSKNDSHLETDLNYPVIDVQAYDWQLMDQLSPARPPRRENFFVISKRLLEEQRR